jgi:exopolyphosphatase/pppGpp-phosphohydrolase
MALGMEKYDPRRIRGYTLGFQELDKLWNFLTGMKIHARRSIFGLDSKRADIILAGIAIFRDILHITEFKELTVSD